MAMHAVAPAAHSGPAVLADISWTFTSLERPAERVRHALEQLRLLVPYDCCGLIHLAGEVVEGTLAPPDSPLGPEVETALRQQLAYLSGQAHPADARIPLQLGRSSGWSSHLAVPLVSGDVVTGVLMVARIEPEPYGQPDLSLLAVVAGQLAGYLALAALRRRELDLLAREQEARQAADAANRAKDRFVAVVSHELRDPINVILGWVSGLRGSSIDPRTVHRAADAIERNAAIQARLIDDLLDIGRAISGKIRLHRQPTDLGLLLATAVDGIRAAADSKQVAVHVSVPEDPVIADADPMRLGQIVRNLLSNAVKFTRTGGRVEALAVRTPDGVRIVVRDNGIGIDAEFLPSIFEEFQQASSLEGSEAAGLGLGLTITKLLVELHGGRIEAFSDGPDKGATFVITLPQ